MYGMTYDEFWNGDLDRLSVVWQAHQYAVEQRNQELWMQGVYIRDAVISVLDQKNRYKYPEQPYRITELSEAEKEMEAKRKVETIREQLLEIKRRWDAKHKGGG
jgi:hypothetical protein